MPATAAVFIDEIEVTPYVVEGSATHALNRVGTAQVRIPMQQAIGEVGSLLKVYFTPDGSTTPQLFHHGRVLLCETSCDRDTGYTVYNSSDPLEMWKWRPVRDPGPVDCGDFSFPTIIRDFVTGPEIVEAMMNGSEGVICGTDADSEGPLFLKRGDFALGGVSLTGAPQDWPMTMAGLATLLVSTGELDIVITPIELEDSGETCDFSDTVLYNYGQIDCYNGNYGDDLSSSVIFQYGMGLRNIQSLRWNEDMTNMCNKLWYFLGPPLDEFHQHWSANVQGDDLGLTYPPGGGLSPPFTSTDNQIGVQDYHSRCAYGVRMDIRMFDDRAATADIGHELYRRQWQIEQYLRAQPQTLVHITPNRDTEILAFDIGDRVLVEASPDVRGGFSGVQRIYEYTISWDTDSVPALSELQVSADNEGFE